MSDKVTTHAAATGNATTDQWIDWITTTATDYVTNNASAVIIGMNSYYSTSPQLTQISMSLSIQLQGNDSDSYSTTRAQGVKSLTPTSASVPAAGGTGTITVDSTMAWTATPSDPWITCTVTATTVNWTVAVNSSGVVQNGTITVAGASGLTQVFAITQAAS
jgi:hypothetical protein